MLADGLIERNLSMLDEMNQKPCITTKTVIDRGKRSTIQSEVKQVKNMNKNLNFLEIHNVKIEVLL